MLLRSENAKMINVLLDFYTIDEPWILSELKRIISSEMKVALIPFSFRDEFVKDDESWQMLYGKGKGKIYSAIFRSFEAYGISEENVSVISYFTDTKQSAEEKINNADIVFFTGGLPDRTFDRIKEFGIYDALLSFDGIVMGYSAGALIQMKEYHLSPDEDYPEFQYAEGLPYLSGFYLEVHYNESEAQISAIKRVIKECGMPVYATRFGKGALIIKDREINTVGEVEIFS